MAGSARHFGKPISATVYTNGQVNDHIKLFYSDKANNYLINFTELDSLGMRSFFNINLEEKWIGIPVGNGENDYDYIAGHLFQSETGGHFSPFEDHMKGFGFDPQLSFTGKQIKFTVPASRFKFDSVRIELQKN